MKLWVQPLTVAVSYSHFKSTCP